MTEEKKMREKEYKLIQEEYDGVMDMLREKKPEVEEATKVLDLAIIYSQFQPMGLASFRDKVLSRQKPMVDYIAKKDGEGEAL